MTPATEDDPRDAAAQMAEATERLRGHVPGLVPPHRTRRRAPDVDSGGAGASFSTTSHEGTLVLAVVGQVDVGSAASMRRHLFKLLDAGHINVVIDMTGVDFMDSSGLNVLIGAVRAVRPAGGSIRVAAPSTQLRQLFEVTGVHKILDLYESVASACRGVRGPQ